jgi:hypothetical protein
VPVPAIFAPGSFRDRRTTASPLSSAFLQRLALLTDLHSNKSEVACGASKADFRS